jgi:hypothetical protein
MRGRLLIAIFFLCFLSFFRCKVNRQDTKVIEGDLYYSWFRMGNFYNQPDSLVRGFKLYIDTVNAAFPDAIDRKYVEMYETLKKKNLLYSPFIEMKLDNDSILIVYFNNSDYDRVKVFHRQELIDTKKKVRIKLEIEDLRNGMALNTKFISVDKVDGETLQNDKKSRIEDYH